MSVWVESFTKVLITIEQILTAGIAITAFSLLLYAYSFNLKNRVARSFAVILTFVVIVFSAEALETTATYVNAVDFWLRLQWIGILFLPAAYMHFSDALLATTGKPSRWRRKWAVRISYLISFGFLCLLPTGLLLGSVTQGDNGIAFFQRTFLTEVFTIYYIVMMALSWVNFIRAFRRTVTKTSRRRMTYLVVSAIAPAIGSFPYLIFGSQFVSDLSLIFWVIAIAVNLVTGGLIVVMAYSVAFFGVPWPDRVVKSRLIKWLLRGPITAIITLALVTIIRRTGSVLGNPYTAFVPITMVVTILLMEYMITLFFPKFEEAFLFGNDQNELIQLRSFEERLLTRSDLSQFLEMILAAVCDQLQAKAAYLATNVEGTFEISTTMGIQKGEIDSSNLEEYIINDNFDEAKLLWEGDVLFPLKDGEDEPNLVGYLGVRNPNQSLLEEDEVISAVNLLNHRAALALRDREIQEQVFSQMEKIDPQVEMIENLRAAGRYDRKGILVPDQSLQNEDMNQWIKDALTHYWGGPKLTENPLNSLKIVKARLIESENNSANALRSVLKAAIEKLKPEGERKYTSEWILYNILDMKFLEGKKVKEIAMRLSMSEADLYRKQRVAIDAVANEIEKMETDSDEIEKSE